MTESYCNDGRCVLNRRGQKHGSHGKGIKIDESDKGPTHKPVTREGCNDGRCKLTRKGERHPAHTECSQLTSQVVVDIKRDEVIAADSEAREQKNLGEKYTFPKKVGIVFLERRIREAEKHAPYSVYQDIHLWRERKNELSLDFDQDACAYFLMQMNHHQTTFDFQVVPLIVKTNDKEGDRIPKNNHKECLFEWLDDFAGRISNLNIDYWMGITSELVPGQPTWHFKGKNVDETTSHKILWIITSRNWEKYRSPPSLFEYLLTSVFRCTLQSLSLELEAEKNEIKEMKFLRAKGHKVTRGCVFDFTHRRASVSIFKLCLGCQKKLRSLEKLITEKRKNWDVNLVDDVTTILSKTWMGTPEKRDSPLFNLKKMYKYDVDRNSGFYKKWYQRITDSMIDNLTQWIIVPTIAGIISIVLYLIFGIKP